MPSFSGYSGCFPTLLAVGALLILGLSAVSANNITQCVTRNIPVLKPSDMSAWTPYPADQWTKLTTSAYKSGTMQGMSFLMLTQTSFTDVVLKGTIAFDAAITDDDFVGWISHVLYPGPALLSQDTDNGVYDLVLADWKRKGDGRASEGFRLGRVKYACSGFFSSGRATADVLASVQKAFPVGTRIDCGCCAATCTPSGTRTSAFVCDDPPDTATNASESYVWWDRFSPSALENPPISLVNPPVSVSTLQATQFPCCKNGDKVRQSDATGKEATCVGGPGSTDLNRVLIGTGQNNNQPFLWENTWANPPASLSYYGAKVPSCSQAHNKSRNGWRPGYVYMFEMHASSSRYTLRVSYGSRPHGSANLTDPPPDHELLGGLIFNVSAPGPAVSPDGFAAEGYIGLYTMSQNGVDFASISTATPTPAQRVAGLPLCTDDKIDVAVDSNGVPMETTWGMETGPLLNDFDPFGREVHIALPVEGNGSIVLNHTGGALGGSWVKFFLWKTEDWAYTSQDGLAWLNYKGAGKYIPPASCTSSVSTCPSSDTIVYRASVEMPARTVVESKDCTIVLQYPPPPIASVKVIPLDQSVNVSCTRTAGEGSNVITTDSCKCSLSLCPDAGQILTRVIAVGPQGEEICSTTWSVASASTADYFDLAGDVIISNGKREVNRMMGTPGLKLTYTWFKIRASSGSQNTNVFVPVFRTMPQCWLAGKCTCNETWPTATLIKPPDDMVNDKTYSECECPPNKEGVLCELCMKNPFDGRDTWGDSCEKCENPVGPQCDDCHAPKEILEVSLPQKLLTPNLTIETCADVGKCRQFIDPTKRLPWRSPGECDCFPYNPPDRPHVLVFRDGSSPSFCTKDLTLTPTFKPSPTSSSSRTPSASPSRSITASSTRTTTLSHTPSPTPFHTPSRSESKSFTWSRSTSSTATATLSTTRTSTLSYPATHTPTFTLPTSTATHIRTYSRSPTLTPTSTPVTGTFTTTSTPTHSRTRMRACDEKSLRWDPESLVRISTSDPLSWNDGPKFYAHLENVMRLSANLEPHSYLIVGTNRRVTAADIEVLDITIAFCGGVGGDYLQPVDQSAEFVKLCRKDCNLNTDPKCIPDQLSLVDVQPADTRLGQPKVSPLASGSAASNVEPRNQSVLFGIVGGVVVGVICLIALLAGACFWVARRSQRKTDREATATEKSERYNDHLHKILADELEMTDAEVRPL